MEFKNNIDYLDQHFLIDKKVINAIIDSSELRPTDNVIEIGPGKGVLTSIIVKKVKHLACVEIDLNLEHFLSVLEDSYDNLDIIYGNVLDTFIPACDKIISALPYSITEPFIEKLLCCEFKEGILLVGKNFADSVVEKRLNKLSLLTNSFFEVTRIMDVTPDSFEPRPRVMSSLIKIKRISRKRFINDQKQFMFREMFFNRTRKMKNNLMESLIEYYKLYDKKLTKKESKSIIDGYGIDSSILSKVMENLTNAEISIIYNSIKTESLN